MDLSAIFGKLNLMTGLVAIETAVCFHKSRRELYWVKWFLCLAFMIWLSLVANSNAHWEDRALALEVIISNMPGRTLITFIVAVQIWLCYKMTIQDALFYMTVSMSCQKMEYNSFKIIEHLLETHFSWDIAGNASILLNLTVLLMFCVAIHFIFRRTVSSLSDLGGWPIIILAQVILLTVEIIHLYMLVHDPFINFGSGMVAFCALSVLTNSIMLVMLYNLIGRRTLYYKQQAIEAIARQRNNQLAFSQDLIDSINIKSHDLKKQIGYLKGNKITNESFIKELESIVSDYDTMIETENQTLSTVLSEKSMVCHQHNIPFSCVADGKGIGFIDELDLYTLFSNLLDNAIEASCASGLERRGIDLIMKQQAGFLSIHEENYFAGEIKLLDGRPITNKANTYHHGFGTRSMMQLVEKYGGTIKFQAKDGVFRVNILIPLPEEIS